MAGIQPHPRPTVGGWLSGSMGINASDLEIDAILQAAGAEAGDHRPQYPPAKLLFRVIEQLANDGIYVEPGRGQMHVAGIAAADLLRALGVAPVSTTALPG